MLNIKSFEIRVCFMDQSWIMIHSLFLGVIIQDQVRLDYIKFGWLGQVRLSHTIFTYLPCEPERGGIKTIGSPYDPCASQEATEWSRVAGLGTRSLFLSFYSLLFSVLLFPPYEGISLSIPFLFFILLFFLFLSLVLMRDDSNVAGFRYLPNGVPEFKNPLIPSPL